MFSSATHLLVCKGKALSCGPVDHPSPHMPPPSPSCGRAVRGDRGSGRRSCRCMSCVRGYRAANKEETRAARESIPVAAVHSCTTFPSTERQHTYRCRHIPRDADGVDHAHTCNTWASRTRPTVAVQRQRTQHEPTHRVIVGQPANWPSARSDYDRSEVRVALRRCNTAKPTPQTSTLTQPADCSVSSASSKVVRDL